MIHKLQLMDNFQLNM